MGVPGDLLVSMGIACIMLFGAAVATAQTSESALADRAPRFLRYSGSHAPVRLDVTKTPMLTRRISVEFNDVTVDDALRGIIERSGLHLMYSASTAPLDRKVHLKAEDITVAAALTEVLLGANVDVVFTESGRAMLVRRSDTPEATAPVANGTIAGTARDEATHAPIRGASVTLDNSSRGAVTGDDGTYRITGVPAGRHTLAARALGFSRVTRTVDVIGDSVVTVDVELKQIPTRLNDIVTTATGSQRRVAVGNAISTINTDSVVATSAVKNLSDVLTARAPGVQVFGTGGLTGAAPRINIRGQNSVQLSSQPILIVDGVRVSNTAASRAPDGSFIGVSSGRFDDISPDAIESIEIVKGPSAATLYGTDAANGVIVITTKRGVAGERRWNLTGEAGTQTLDTSRFPDNYYGWGSFGGQPVNCTLKLIAFGVCTQDSVTHFNPVKFDATTPIGTGNRTKLGFDVSGGNAIRYYASGTYEDEVGYYKMPDADKAIYAAERGGLGFEDYELRPNAARRISALMNVTAPLAHNAELQTSAIVQSQRTRIPFTSALLYSAGPGYRDVNDGWSFGIRPGDAFVQRNLESTTHVIGSSTATWKPLSWLNTRATGGLDFSSSYFDALTHPGEGGLLSTDITGYRSNTKTNITLYSGDAGATATFNVNPWLSSRTSIGAQYNRSQTLLNSAQARGLAPGSETVAGGSRLSATESTVQSVVAGTYIEQTFGIQDHLFLTGAVRADGGSTFGRDFNTAIYPKASLSWLVPRIPGFSSLRVRAAYGTSGVQPSAIAALAREQLFPTFVDNTPTTGAVLSSIGNPDLKPERQREFEGGIDAEWLGGRARLELTGYRKRSTDALINVPQGPSIGGGIVPTNIGSVENTGFEWLLSLRPIDISALTWDVSMNGSTNKNKLVSLGAGISPTYGRLGVTSTVPGYPLFSYFDFPIESYSDANGNGILEQNEVVIGAQPVFYGSSYPRTQFSVSNSFGLFHGQLQLSALVDHRGRFIIANLDKAGNCFTGYCRAAVDPNTPLAEQAPVVAYNPLVPNYTLTNFLENGSFTRLREVSVTYQLPESVRGKLHSRAASLTLAGRNLALWTKADVVDPESQGVIGGAFNAAYVSQGGAPTARYWTLRINLGF